MMIEFARMLFLRIHVVAQLFMPLSLVGQLDKKNYTDLIAPINTVGHGHATYTIIEDHDALVQDLQSRLSKQP